MKIKTCHAIYGKTPSVLIQNATTACHKRTQPLNFHRINKKSFPNSALFRNFVAKVY
jgi:hypothetical protein